ncbi:coiled-coil and C2 domain-containing protein 2A-like, partial [Diaphorina citri]|uniref:Coiled-coil and C2 domain-containing protein 2A-like n=1 Tax=Diaphorina citri TaxID=121845 RepID=A0A3Q0JC29_DIACI
MKFLIDSKNTRYVHRTSTNISRRVAQRLAALRSAKYALVNLVRETEEQEGEERKKNVDAIQKYKLQIREARALKFREQKMDRELLAQVLITWRELKHLRELQKYSNTDLKLKITQVEDPSAREDYETEINETWNEMLEEALDTYEEQKKIYDAWLIKHQDDDEPSPPEDRLEPPSPVNQEALREAMMSQLAQSVRPPTEPLVHIELAHTGVTPESEITDQSELTRRAALRKVSIWLKILYNGVELCRSPHQPLSCDFRVRFNQLFTIRILNPPEELSVEIHSEGPGKCRPLASVFVPIPNSASTLENSPPEEHEFGCELIWHCTGSSGVVGIASTLENSPPEEHEFGCELIWHCTGSSGVGSGTLFYLTPESGQGNSGQGYCLYTSGTLRCMAGWMCNEGRVYSVPPEMLNQRSLCIQVSFEGFSARTTTAEGANPTWNLHPDTNHVPVRPFVEVSFEGFSARTTTAEGANPTWNHPDTNHTQRCLTSMSIFQVPVRPFVEVSFEGFSARTTSAEGSNPTWNLHPDTNHAQHLIEDEAQRENNIHQRLERNWLGSLTIPFSTLYFNSKIEGTFKLYSPPFLLGYDRSTSCEEASYLRHSTFLTLIIMVQPPLNPPEPLTENLDCSEAPYVEKHLRQFQAEYKLRFPHREMKSLVIDVTGRLSTSTHSLTHSLFQNAHIDEESTHSSQFRLNLLTQMLELCSVQDIETNPRLTLLTLRDRGEPEFRGMRSIPLREREIPNDVFKIYEKRLQSPSFPLEISSAGPQQNSLELVRSWGGHCLKNIRDRVLKQCKLAQQHRTHTDVISEDHVPDVGTLGLTFVKWLQPDRPLRPKRKERKKVPVQSLSGQEVKVLVSVVRAFEIPIRKDVDAISEDKISMVPVRPFVEVSFEGFSARTTSAEGANPTWNLDHPDRFDRVFPFCSTRTNAASRQQMELVSDMTKLKQWCHQSQLDPNDPNNAPFFTLLKNALIEQESTYSSQFRINLLTQMLELCSSIPYVESLTFVKWLQPDRPLRPKRKERKKVPVQSLSGQEVKVLVSVVRAFEIPIRKDVDAISEDKISM